MKSEEVIFALGGAAMAAAVVWVLVHDISQMGDLLALSSSFAIAIAAVALVALAAFAVFLWRGARPLDDDKEDEN